MNPAESSSSRDPVEQLAESFLERYRRGERPSLTEYMRAHPELADDIRDLFPALAEIEALKSNELGPSSNSSALRSPLEGTPARLGEYRLVRVIGRGGMGVVYEAIQETLGRNVAVKVLPPEYLANSTYLKRFRREARSAAGLHHSNIVPIFGFGEQDGHHYFAMQYIRGQTLEAVLEEVRRLHRGEPPVSASEHRTTPFDPTAIAHSLVDGRFHAPVPAEVEEDGHDGPRTPRPEQPAPTEIILIDAPGSSTESPSSDVISSSDSLARQSESRYHRSVAKIALQVAEALSYAHEQGVLHRDIKPSNILIDLYGTAWVADFGLAKLANGEDLSASRDVVGTLRYMAPERFEGRSDRRSDVYGLGVTLYEMLTLRPAFEAVDQPRLMQQVIHGKPTDPHKIDRRIPRDLETICLKCLEKDPRRRFATARELADELVRFLEHRPIRSRPVPTLARIARWGRRNPALAAVSGLAAAAVIGAIGLSVAFGVFQFRAASQLERALFEAKRERREADRLAAAATLDRAQAICEQGSLEHGMLELAHCLEMAQRAESAPLQELARAGLADWREYAPRLDHFLDQGSEIGALARSPNGRLVATAGRDGSAQVWELTSGQRLCTLKLPAAITTVAFSPNSKQFLMAGTGALRLVDLATEQTVLALDEPSTSAVSAFSPDGKWLLTTSKDGAVYLRDTTSGREVGQPLHHNSEVLTATFSPDGLLVLTGCRDGNVQIWDARTGQPVGSALSHKSSVLCAVFSPDGTRLASGLDEGGAQVWDVASQRPLGPILPHDAAVNSLLFHPDGRLLATGCRDWKARFWLLDQGDQAPAPVLMIHQAAVTAMAFSSDGSRLLTGSRDSKARIWTVPEGRLLHVLMHEAELCGVAFGTDERSVITASWESYARAWTLPASNEAGESIVLAHPGPLYTVAFRPDGQLVATGGEEPSVQLWDTATGEGRGVLPHDDVIRGLAFSPDGRFLATASEDKKARWWDLATGRVVWSLEHPGKLSAIAVSPDGLRLLTSTREGILTIWDLTQGTQLSAVPALKGPAWSLAYSADGERFLSGGIDHWVRLRDVRTNQPAEHQWRHQGQVWAVAFDRAGKMALSGGEDQTIRLCDLTAQTVVPFTLYHREPVRSLALSPDGRFVLGGGRNGRAGLWDIITRQSVGAPRIHAGAVLSADVRQIGDRLVFQTASEEKRIHRWSFPPPLAGTVERVILETQVATGMELENGVLHSLDVADWQARRRRLESR